MQGYFNPHTREGCDIEQGLERCMMRISIHTPVKGVTSLEGKSRDEIIHFNPHTREGCDKQFLLMVILWIDFNPHTREGCD